MSELKLRPPKERMNRGVTRGHLKVAATGMGQVPFVADTFRWPRQFSLAAPMKRKEIDRAAIEL